MLRDCLLLIINIFLPYAGEYATNSFVSLSQPSYHYAFHSLIQANIREAKKRITLASLYFGTGPLEDGLVMFTGIKIEI